MVGVITDAGAIVFQCMCGRSEKGTSDDTLITYIPVGGSVTTTGNYEILVYNSPHDPAGNKVSQDCPQCSLDYMTMTLLPPSESVVYACSCGYRAARVEYLRDLNSRVRTSEQKHGRTVASLTQSDIDTTD